MATSLQPTGILKVEAHQGRIKRKQKSNNSSSVSVETEKTIAKNPPLCRPKTFDNPPTTDSAVAAVSFFPKYSHPSG